MPIIILSNKGEILCQFAKNVIAKLKTDLLWDAKLVKQFFVKNVPTSRIIFAQTVIRIWNISANKKMLSLIVLRQHFYCA